MQPRAKEMDYRLHDGIAFKALCDLMFKGKERPSGYNEPLLHQARKTLKNG